MKRTQTKQIHVGPVAIGGGGLGDVAIRYGYSRWDTKILLATVVLLVILMQIIQIVGSRLSKKLDRRLTH